MRKNFLFKKWPPLEIFFYNYMYSCLMILSGIKFLFFSFVLIICENMSFITVDFTKELIKKLNLKIGKIFTLILLYIFLLYIVHCSYFFLFKFNFLNIYGLKWGRKTNLISLLETSSLFSFFCFPVLINFQRLIFPNEDSAFEIALGEKKMFDIAGHNAINYFPFITVIILFLTLINFPFFKYL